MVKRIEMETFTQIIFPPLPKTVIVPEVVERPLLVGKHIRDEVFCGIRTEWVDLVECLFCSDPKKTLEKIMEEGYGCVNGIDYCSGE